MFMTNPQRIRMMILIWLIFCKTDASHQQGNMFCPLPCTCHINPGVSPTLHINCSRQGLDSVPKSLASQLAAQLDLSKNNIGKLKSDYFTNYESLQELNLKHSRITQIESKTFFPLKQLKIMDLSYNFLTYLDPEIFMENRVLEKVLLRRNEFSMVGDNLPILSSVSIKYLDMSNCKLSNLSLSTFSGIPNLEFLDISKNKLQTLSNETLKSISHVKRVNLGNNEFKCRPEFYILLCWATERHNTEPLTCSMKNGKKKTFVHSTQVQLCLKYIATSFKPKETPELSNLTKDSTSMTSRPTSFYETSQISLENSTVTYSVSLAKNETTKVIGTVENNWPVEENSTLHDEIISHVVEHQNIPNISSTNKIGNGDGQTSGPVDQPKDDQTLSTTEGSDEISTSNGRIFEVCMISFTVSFIALFLFVYFKYIRRNRVGHIYQQANTSTNVNGGFEDMQC